MQPFVVLLKSSTKTAPYMQKFILELLGKVKAIECGYRLLMNLVV